MREEAVGVPGIVERLQWVAQLFANSHNGLLITDHLGTVIDVNPTFTTITPLATASGVEAPGGNVHSRLTVPSWRTPTNVP